MSKRDIHRVLPVSVYVPDILIEAAVLRDGDVIDEAITYNLYLLKMKGG